MKEELQIPQVSVIMATFNRRHLIEETLNSLRRQSFEDWECLIIDDGSTDNTAVVVEKNIKGDKRFHYFKRAKKYSQGLPGSRNNGLDLAKGRYIMFVDDDDILHPENLQVSVNVLEKYETSFCRFDKKPFTGNWTENNLNKIDKFKEELFRINDLEKMITGKIPFASCTVLWSRRCFQNLRFNEELMYAEEWECYTRILSEGYEGVSIEQVLYFNRKHSNSNTAEFWENDQARVSSYVQAAIEIISVLKKKNLFTPGLKNFFLRLGFNLRNKEIIEETLFATGAGKFEKMQYLMGLKYYSWLRPIFYIKGKILRN
ncbi:glycosyltransferase family 2 protein [Antarcticibacterium flavum]|uniref:Glycosyltransferase family 2 protein n=1 Tax=Antarcticibacterium flavum TaxID=2058175 RepID=A0A5B7X5C2_9FLAO|nr:glycosyltransferase family 2 protein [Antarcticibacterium flavum]MCM4161399.1 glycosyltransferase family 2 protein [Antarcticibacterium sp. W02-3]QCY70577.1 glycosyltransferase family 2 protein [Antarcticibacterium flavum]